MEDCYVLVTHKNTCCRKGVCCIFCVFLQNSVWWWFLCLLNTNYSQHLNTGPPCTKWVTIMYKVGSDRETVFLHNQRINPAEQWYIKIDSFVFPMLINFQLTNHHLWCLMRIENFFYVKNPAIRCWHISSSENVYYGLILKTF